MRTRLLRRIAAHTWVWLVLGGWHICPALAQTVDVIEYYNASQDHYFISSLQPDIQALDSGRFAGWVRTGYSFKAYPAATGMASPVCRFYIPPPYGDSHFYSASPAECQQVAAKWPYFVEESTSVMYVDLPDANTGACPGGDVPVYRVWDDRADTNHRYTTDINVRNQMVARGWIAEGYGPAAVIICAPAPAASAALELSVDGATVYDVANNVTWLANANLAGDANMRAQLGVTGIDPNGAMDFATAQKWVAALNAYNGGIGYLGHHDWQLPVAPLQDATCGDIGSQGGSFGPFCKGSALGSLYYAGLNQTFPNSVAARFGATVGPIQNLKQSYYWALQNDGGTGSGAGGGGQEVFSFANGMRGGTTTKDSYYYVLPMVPGAIGTPPPCPGAVPPVIAYTSGPAAGNAVYDCSTGFTWAMNANLAAQQSFGISGSSTITFGQRSITVPLINDGAMLFATAMQWTQGMNASRYLGSSNWQTPASAAILEQLFNDLNFGAGDARMMWTGSIGPFRNLQPSYYWGCQRTQTGTSESPCAGYAPPDGAAQLQWSFDFDYGFQNTSSIVQKFFVTVYCHATPPN